jgi:hypothetical protein
MIKKILTSLLLFFTFVSNAQTSGPAMADSFRDDGKIYVVITVIGIIFAAIIIFLIYIERKLQKLEEKLHNK